MLIFGSFGLKRSIYHVTKDVKRLLFQLLVSFDFLKSILDDAIVDTKIIFKFGLKIHFLNNF